MGLLTSDLKYDQMRTVFMTEGAIDGERLDRDLAAAAEELRGRLRDDGVAGRGDRGGGRAGLPLRRAGLRAADPAAGGTIHGSALEKFHSQHEQEYGHAFRDPIEIVNLRVTAYGKRPRIEQLPGSGGTASTRCWARARASSAAPPTPRATSSAGASRSVSRSTARP